MFKKLEANLGYTFNTKALLREALTHNSSELPYNYQRLEFLGDTVIQIATTTYLYNHFPKAAEGNLSRARSSLVNRHALSEISKELDLASHVIHGQSLEESVKYSPKYLTDYLEAIIGAILVDTHFDYEVSIRITTRILKSILDNVSIERKDNLDPKTFLQEYTQKLKGSPRPIYQVVGEEGADHDKRFTMSCKLGNLVGKGTYKNKRGAEQAAARNLLEAIGVL